MRMRPLRKVLLLIGLTLGLAACGSHDGSAPSDGSLVISPPSRTISVGGMAGPNCTATPSDIFPFLISTFDAQGRPRGEVDIDVILQFAPNTTFGPVVMILLDDTNGDGVLEQVLVATPGSGIPYRTKTDDFGNKTVHVFLELTTGCFYAGDLTVISGSLFAAANIEVEM